jgi:hypothetical protein
MTERLAGMSDEVFARLWNEARDLNDAAERVREVAGRVPRWAVLARASALRRQGVALKRHELRGLAG